MLASRSAMELRPATPPAVLLRSLPVWPTDTAFCTAAVCSPVVGCRPIWAAWGPLGDAREALPCFTASSSGIPPAVLPGAAICYSPIFLLKAAFFLTAALRSPGRAPGFGFVGFLLKGFRACEAAALEAPMALFWALPPVLSWAACCLLAASWPACTWVACVVVHVFMRVV